MWQYLTENGKIKTAYEYEFRIKWEESVWRYLAAGEKPTSWQRKRQKEYWATSSHWTAHNHVYDLSARVENSELKNVLLKIAPDRIDARRKWLDARKLSVEEQAIMFLVDLFKNPRAVKNANGQRVKVEDYLGLAAMWNNWSQDMIYAIFHHTSPDDAWVRSNMKRWRDVVNWLTW